MLTLFILSYTLGAVITYGAVFAFGQQRNYDNDWSAALLFAIPWPAGIPALMIEDGRMIFQSGLKFY